MGSGLDQVLVVTGHHLFRECLVTGLNTRIPSLVLETAETVKQALQLCEAGNYVLAIFDADPPDPFSPAMARKFRRLHSSTNLVILGRRRDEDDIITYLEAGAIDFRCTETESLDDFCEAIEACLRHQFHYGPERTRAIFSRLQQLSAEVSRINVIDTLALSDREMEILRLVDEGRSNKQIAKALHISLHTVKNHVHRILEKLQVTNRREAVHLAYVNGWLKVNGN